MEILGDEKLLPLPGSAKIAAFAVVTGDNLSSQTEFFRYLAQAFTGDIDFGYFDKDITAHDIDAIKSGILQSEYIVFIILSDRKDFVLDADIPKIMKEFKDDKTCIIVTNLELDDSVLAVADLTLRLSDSGETSIVSAIVKLSGKTMSR